MKELLRCILAQIAYGEASGGFENQYPSFRLELRFDCQGTYMVHSRIERTDRTS